MPANPSNADRSEPPGRLAGIDYGTVRVGVAVTDSRQSLASPYENYTRRGLKHDAAWFKQFAVEERIARFIVGLPVHLDGQESAKSYEARQFGAWLTEVTGLPVEYFDERFTSFEAESSLLAAGLTSKRRKARLDKLAAQVMLAAYLDAQAGGRTAGSGDPPPALDA